MPAKRLADLRSMWKERLARPRPIGITPFEQAQRSWARSIVSYADIPADYAAYFDPLHAAGAPVPLVVVAPSFEGFLHQQAEKLVCATSGEIAILERRGHSLLVRCYPMPGISSVEVSSMLLEARLKITGLEARSRDPSSTSVRYNAVTEFLLTPIVVRIRAAGRTITAGPRGRSNDDVFDSWGRRNYKFMNYAKRSLLADEEVHVAILQPEIRVSVSAAFGGALRRTVSPTHATILTDHELISIREKAHPGGRDRYGGVWEYIPLPRIDGLSVGIVGRGLVGLSVHLPGHARLDLQYEDSARPELEALAARFSQLRCPLPATTARPSL